ncbi:MAG: cytochrome c biogenesis protein ResB [Deltaproteobacteria bacterium]|nr:cytochrome c biogenesis protein ResB [Deltaproteobacteria bacterium]
MAIIKNIKNINLQKVRENKLYKRFASLKTSCVFLGILVGFYILGTIFPQGASLDDYIKSGGRFTSFVIFFDLLNLFTTPGFLITAFLLFINLTICAIERFLMLRSQRKTVSDGSQFSESFSFPLDINPQLESAEESVKEIFKKELKFNEKACPHTKDFGVGACADSGITIMEKGWSYRWLTWIYHSAILLCFFGFFLTYLFSYEDEITLYPGEAAAIKPAAVSRWNKSWGSKPQELGFKLMLDEFITEYNQFPKLDYPADKLSRLAVAMGWKDPKYILKNESYFPKDWKSRLKVINLSPKSVIGEGKQTVLEKTIEVNDPLSYQGITFYQAAYKQNLKVQVDDNPILFETEVGKELIIPGIDGMLKFGAIRTGMLFKKDGSTEKIKPFTEATLIKEDSSGKREVEKLGKLEQDGGLYVADKRISLREFKEASILSYRYDPGVPVLWWSGVIVLLAMAIRIFGAWYRIIYRIEEKNGRPHLLFKVKTRGLMADEERLIKMVQLSFLNMTEPIDLDTPV